MITEKIIDNLLDRGYSFEEIDSVKNWLKNIEDWKYMDFEDVLKIYYKDNSENICIK